MSSTEPPRFAFDADIRKLLDIVVHSLYTDTEIFVRELVSNASDALEKLRLLQLTETDVFDAAVPLEIDVTTDSVAKTLTIRDTGVGMTREELIRNLGTIAHSGSRAFLEAMGENQDKQASLIGQFGVGFYSAFMVAKKVSVYTRTWRQGEAGYCWTSDGTGTYEIADAGEQRRGAMIVLEMKEDCADFASDWKIRDVVSRYSAFVPFPINLNGERMNMVEALWLRGRNEATEEAYTEFYKFQANAYDEPRMRLHFSSDAPVSINALLFVPKENSEKHGLIRNDAPVALYSRRVLIDAHPKDLLPNWLRFLRGVVDSDDIPLNISRESMQDRPLVAKLRSLITVRFLRFLDEESANHPEAYDDFYLEFGRFIKEGAAVDFSQRDRLANLLRFESSVTESGKSTSLAAYVSRMKPEQTAIYYLIGPNRAAIERGPYLEGLKARGLEVLFSYEPVDEYVMSNVQAYDSKKIVAADHADIKIPLPPGNERRGGEGGLTADETQTLITWLKGTLDDRVTSVVVSDRLVGSPVLAVSADRMTSPHMRRAMRAMNKQGGNAPVRVTLEVNSRHALCVRLLAMHTTDPDTATLVAEQLLDNALLSAGLLDDPTAMVSRLNKLLEHV
jgi:molecular chaperone HtpG